MRLLIGCDSSGSSAHDALALAALLTQVSEVEVVLGVVLPGIEPWEEFHSHGELLEVGSAATFARAKAYLHELAPRVATEQRAIGGESPAGGLRDLAVSEGADMIVIASTHRGTLGRLVPGTTADHLLAHAPCPVAVAPRGYAKRTDRNLRVIGIAYDGSPESQRAARLALGLAERAATGLRAFGALGPLVSATVPGVPTRVDEASLRDRLERELDELLAGLPPSIGGQKLILAGSPAEALLKLGGRAADLMVFGTHGFGPLMRLIGGSVTSGVLNAPPWPVIVVPPRGPVPLQPAGRADERRRADAQTVG